MIATKGTGFDVILVSGEPYADHPLSPVGMIARVLDAEGYKVGIIECPDWKKKEDFLKLGRPRLFFGVTSGSIDSMLVNYTPLKRERAVDPNAPFQSRMPDRAVIVYANRIRELHKGARIVLGGIEASLRRFAHYDYWGDDVRRSILLDTRADILVYGPGEIQAVEIARRLDRGEGLDGIRGHASSGPRRPRGRSSSPRSRRSRPTRTSSARPKSACRTGRTIAQKHANRFVVQYPAPDYTPADLDRVYGLPFTRRIPEGFPELGMARFSVQTHRGCVGRCSFCALSLHQGDRIVSRSEGVHPRGDPADDEAPGVERLRRRPGRADGQHVRHGPAGVAPAHRRLIGLMRAARKVPGVKKVFVRSGIRYDLALESPEYVRELVRHHVSGLLKIAPEHVSDKVLRLMNKSGGRRRLDEFRRLFGPSPRRRAAGPSTSSTTSWSPIRGRPRRKPASWPISCASSSGAGRSRSRASRSSPRRP